MCVYIYIYIHIIIIIEPLMDQIAKMPPGSRRLSRSNVQTRGDRAVAPPMLGSKTRA